MPARLRLIPLAIALATAPVTSHAQYVPRPWLDWRTTRTEHFDVHYPAQYAEWTRAVAARLEGARIAVGAVVGYLPDERVQVLVDDPANVPNGFALPLLDRPTMVFFPVPPTPRQSIGNSRDWGEMLAVHEFAHLAHLTRPARRRLDPGRLLPVPVGPIARRAPRWVIEGFATYVEGRVTGSGRPHNAQRAAVLRQWALEGRLPSYAQMSHSNAYAGGSFAYLVGSAYLEWLAAREGDSTITHLWRRLTARTPRSFTEAFRGVYGRTPPELYARFTVEVTGEALAVERTVDSLGGVHAGTLVQRLTWETGDPAVSPDGARVALVLRSPTRPGRVVVWNAGADSIPPRAAAARDSALARARRRDPLDVPDREFFPPPKIRLAVLQPRAGRAFDTPRFMPDGRRILVSHAEPIGGGAFRPDLYLWDPESDDLRRVTHGAAVRQADPEPGGSHAVAVQCTRGWCDVVRVDLTTGRVTLLREGSPAVSYYRPRVSPAGDRIAVAEQRDHRWRIVLIDAREPSRVEELRPSGGAPGNRFDVAWADSGRALVVVSDASGIANLEYVDLASRTARPITRVTGAALAPDVDPATGDVWFLGQHAAGLDVRRLDAPHAPVALPVFERPLFPVVPAPPATPPPPLAVAPPAVDHPYGLGPRTTRWLPGLTSDASGATAQLLVVNGDPVGRLEASLVGAFGSAGGWRGARAWATLRRWRPALTAEVFGGTQQPATTADAASRGVLDATFGGAGIRARMRADRAVWRGTVSGGAAAMRVGGASTIAGPATRAAGWLAIEGSRSARLLGIDLSGAARLHGDAGRHAGRAIGHLTASVAAGVDLPILQPIAVSLVHATLHEDAGLVPFERVTVGGAAPVLFDPLLLPQRIAMPALPTGALVGHRATVARAALGGAGLVPFYWAARVDGDAYGGWQRVAGLEARFSSAAVPLVPLPRVDLTGGIGYSIDRPFKGRTTVYVGAAYRP